MGGFRDRAGEPPARWPVLVESDRIQIELDRFIRLSDLHATDPTEIADVIGELDQARIDRRVTRLADPPRP
jgi:hypothetical protein